MFTARYGLNLLSVRLCFVFQVPIKTISCFLRQLIYYDFRIGPQIPSSAVKPNTPYILLPVTSFYSNKLHIINTYIYPQQPATCFGVCYTNFRQTIALLVQQMYFLLIWLYNSFIEFWPSQPTLSILVLGFHRAL
jgi:hypothetical protein